MLIVGIEPRAPGLHIFTQAYTPRAGLPRLLTQARALGYQCIIFCEEIRSSQIDWTIIAQADLILISSISSTAPRAYNIIKLIKEYNNHAVILGGGPHFTFEYQEALNNGIDYVFRHWADHSFFEWLNWYQSLTKTKNINETDLQKLLDIHGLAYKIAGHVHRTGLPEVVNPDSWPTPDFRLVRGYKPRFITLITSEGCDHNCEFCSEWTMHGAQYRSRSPEKVISDIQYYRKLYGKIPIFFGDDNIAADLKNRQGEILISGHDRLKALCELILQTNLQGTYSGQVRLSLADQPELLALMAKVGFDRVYIGYESINPANTKSVGNKLNFDQMATQTMTFHQNGIAIHAMWVLGFDHDTLDTIKKTIESCIKWRIGTNQFLILMPLPGSPLRSRLMKEGRIIHNDWEKYDGHHVVFIPKLMKAWELQSAIILEAMPKVYNLGQTMRIYLSSNIRTLRRWLTRQAPHPDIEFKSAFITLILRLVGRDVVRQAKKPAKKYLRSLPK